MVDIINLARQISTAPTRLLLVQIQWVEWGLPEKSRRGGGRGHQLNEENEETGIMKRRSEPRAAG